MRNKKQEKNQKSQKNKKNTKLRKLQKRKMENLGSNEKNTINKTGNQERTLQIVQIHFTTGKQRNIMMKINYQTEILENYINKEKSSGKIESKLVTFIEENKKEIKNMNTYLNKEIQIKKERDSVKNSHDNSSTNSLYPPDHQGLTWDTERENLIPEENTFDLEDLYTYGDYDNVLYNEYER